MKQHLIPKCYLESFVDCVIPKGGDSKFYKPPVWVNEKPLGEAPRKRSPGNVLIKKNFYNLENENPERPYIEEYLSRVESDFSAALRKLNKQETLTLEEQKALVVFVDTLFRRPESSLRHWQRQFDKAEALYRKVDRAHSGHELASDIYFAGSHDAAKKLIVNGTGSLAKLFIQNGFSIVVNNSVMPFFTTDSPVIYDFVYYDALRKYSIPDSWRKEEVDKDGKKFLCYCPLTPKYAFLSSPYVKAGDVMYREIEDPSLPLIMNTACYDRAEAVIISCTPAPFVQFQPRVLELIEVFRSPNVEVGFELKIHTNREEYRLRVGKYDRKGVGSPEVSFWTEDLDILRVMSGDRHIELVEFFENGRSIGGTRNLRFNSVAIRADAPTILIANRKY